MVLVWWSNKLANNTRRHCASGRTVYVGPTEAFIQQNITHLPAAYATSTMQWVYANHQIGKRDPQSEHFLSTQTFFWWSTTSSKTWNIETHWSALLDCNGSPQCLTLDIRNSLCEGLGIGPMRLRHRSHHFATWSSHFVDSTVWQTKRAPNEIRLQWRNPHGPFSPPVKLIGYNDVIHTALSLLLSSWSVTMT